MKKKRSSLKSMLVALSLVVSNSLISYGADFSVYNLLSQAQSVYDDTTYDLDGISDDIPFLYNYEYDIYDTNNNSNTQDLDGISDDIPFLYNYEYDIYDTTLNTNDNSIKDDTITYYIDDIDTYIEDYIIDYKEDFETESYYYTEEYTDFEKELYGVTTNTEDTEKRVVTVQIGSTIATIDGKEIELDVAPYIDNGNTMIPVRFLANALDINDSDISYDNDQRIVSIKTINKIKDNSLEYLWFVVGSNEILVTDETESRSISMANDAIPEIVDGRTFMPFRELANLFNLFIDWDNDTKTVTLSNLPIETPDNTINTDVDVDINVDDTITKPTEELPNLNTSSDGFSIPEIPENATDLNYESNSDNSNTTGSNIGTDTSNNTDYVPLEYRNTIVSSKLTDEIYFENNNEFIVQPNEGFFIGSVDNSIPADRVSLIYAYITGSGEVVSKNIAVSWDSIVYQYVYGTAILDRIDNNGNYVYVSQYNKETTSDIISRDIISIMYNSAFDVLFEK